MENRSHYYYMLATKLMECDRKIDELKVRTEGAGDEARVAYKRRIVDLRERRDRAATLLEAAHEADDKGWKDTRKAADRLFTEVDDMLKLAA